MNTHAELSLNVIVMATIAVLVLVVLSYIFISGAKTGSDGLLSCESKGGDCRSSCDSSIELTTSWSCPKETGENAKCCINKEETYGFS